MALICRLEGTTRGEARAVPMRHGVLALRGAFAAQFVPTSSNVPAQEMHVAQSVHLKLTLLRLATPLCAFAL